MTRLRNDKIQLDEELDVRDSLSKFENFFFFRFFSFLR